MQVWKITPGRTRTGGDHIPPYFVQGPGGLPVPTATFFHRKASGRPVDRPPESPLRHNTQWKVGKAGSA